MFKIKISNVCIDDKTVKTEELGAENYRELLNVARQINYENRNSWNWAIVYVEVKGHGTERCVMSFRTGNAIIACAKSLIFQIGLQNID